MYIENEHDSRKKIEKNFRNKFSENSVGRNKFAENHVCRNKFFPKTQKHTL